MPVAWSYHHLEVMTSTTDDEMTLYSLGITLAQLFADDASLWVDVVTPVHECPPFSGPADSGALIYAVEDSQIVPLGVHLGKPVAKSDRSIFLAVEAFWIEGRYHGLDLQFE
jgi:hypothetical protein